MPQQQLEPPPAIPADRDEGIARWLQYRLSKFYWEQGLENVMSIDEPKEVEILVCDDCGGASEVVAFECECESPSNYHYETWLECQRCREEFPDRIEYEVHECEPFSGDEPY